MAASRARIPIIGVTGSIGSGKSTVASLFHQWGAEIVSGDDVARSLLDNSIHLRRTLARAFGNDILRPDGSVDRGLLARRAFVGDSEVAQFNRIIHPPIIREIKRRVRIARARSPKAIVLDAALLVEAGEGHIDWDVLVGVWAPYKSRLARLKRRGLTVSQIRRFSRAQTPWPQKRARADEVIRNDCSIAVLQRRSRLCWLKILSSSRTASSTKRKPKRELLNDTSKSIPV